MSTDFTPEELAEFDKITMQECSLDQMERIEGRLAARRFLAKHCKEKCDAMFAVLKARDAAKQKRKKSK